MSNLTAQMIADAAESFDSFGTCRLYDGGYSGRGMYGKQCFAVVVKSPGDLVLLGMSIAHALVNEAADKAEDPADVADDAADAIDDAIGHAHPQIDSLGTGIVAYWPSIPPLGATEDVA